VSPRAQVLVAAARAGKKAQAAMVHEAKGLTVTGTASAAT
jgi:hypothetical protein